MSEDTRDIEEHLRGASDAIVVLLTEIGQLEKHKRHIPPGEPRFDQVAESVRKIAETLALFTKQEEAWGRVATADRDDLETIEASEAPPSLVQILERWRSVERELDAAEPGSPEASRLLAEFDRLRDEYIAAFRVRAPDEPGR